MSVDGMKDAALKAKNWTNWKVLMGW